MADTKTNVDIPEKNAVSSATTKKPDSKASSVSKMAGNKNALCHGVYSEEITLPWESPADFENLLASFRDEWKPNGCSEEQAVLQLTHCTWIGWRAAKMAHLCFHRAPFGMDLLKSEKKMSWHDILQHEQELPKATASTLSQIDELLRSFSTMLDIVRSRPYQTDTSNGKKMQSELSRLGHELSGTIETFKEMVPTIRKLASLTVIQWTMFDKAYQPEVIEQQVKVMAAIDARIDKVLRRLTALKEYKRIAASQATPSQLTASPSVVPTAPTEETK